MPDQALSEIKVLDLTSHIAGGYCTKLFADYGADVLKVEPPGAGDITRSLGPFLGDEPHPERSGLFIHLNTNKRSITLNLETVIGKRIIKELAATSDIVVESFAPGYLSRLGLGYDELRRQNARLVMASLTDFGQTGPYRDYKAPELVMYGMGSLLLTTGIPTREPVKLGGTVETSVMGNMAATFILGAYAGARFHGSGQHLDISLHELQVGQPERASGAIARYAYSGDVTPRVAESRTLGIPYGVYPCQDGYVAFMTMPLWWPRVAQMLDRPELLTDPRFGNLADIMRNEADFNRDYLYPWLMERTKLEITEKGALARMAVMGINTTKDLIEHPHFAAREYWQRVEHPVVGAVTQTGAPFKMQDGGYQVRRPAPLLGQHNAEVYCDQLGYSRADLVKLREVGVI